MSPGLPRASQTDLLAIIRVRNEIAVIAVEGKVEESFGPLIGDQKHLSAGQKDRLSHLRKLFDVSERDVSTLRYQLFHRAAAAVFEAQRYACTKAFLLVHSFSPKLTGYNDFSAFASAIGLGEGPLGAVLGATTVNSISLYAAWLTDRLPER